MLIYQRVYHRIAVVAVAPPPIEICQNLGPHPTGPSHSAPQGLAEFHRC